MERYRHYNPNPSKKNVGDCTIRAISKAENQDWEKTYLYLCAYGLKCHNMPSANNVWGSYLRSLGYTRTPITVDDYTVEDFCIDHPKGCYVLALQGHVVTTVDGLFYDSWDSGREIIYYYWRKNNV